MFRREVKKQFNEAKYNLLTQKGKRGTNHAANSCLSAVQVLIKSRTSRSVRSRSRSSAPWP